MMPDITGSDTLDEYGKKVDRMERFHTAFSNALLSELTKRSIAYQVEAALGGFNVKYHDLVAEFKYREVNQSVRIRYGDQVSSSEYFIDHKENILEESEVGGRRDIEWSQLISELINPALETKVKDGLASI